MKSRDGKLWFASETTVQVVDPANLRENGLPPPMHVEQLIEWLQGFHGLMLRFQVALRLTPEDQQSRAILADTLNRASCKSPPQLLMRNQ